MLRLLFGLAAIAAVSVSPAQALTVLGTGTGSLVGNDLTDIGDDGDEAAYSIANANTEAGRAGFDAEFFSNVEPGFGNRERAFNIFDNQLGPRNDKFCCSFPSGDPVIIGALFGNAFELTSFTLSSANDRPNRDPLVWEIQGSNDTTTGLDGVWDPIFSRDDDVSDWSQRFQVNQYSVADGDVFQTSDAYSAFRLVIFDTAAGTGGGANVQVGELELFGVAAVPLPPAAFLMLGALGIFGAMRRRAGQTA